MPRKGEEPPAIRVYTVCDESRYLIVRNVPALGCGDELMKLFESYGAVEECKPMDGEDCEPFTDVYWIKFLQVSNARFAKRKLDEFVFLGNQLDVSYAPHFEGVSDTKEKLEGRRKEVLRRINIGRSKGPKAQISNYPHNQDMHDGHLLAQTPSQTNCFSQQMSTNKWDHVESTQVHNKEDPYARSVSSNKEYFSSSSMNATVRLVREKLDKIQSSSQHMEAGPAVKKTRVDNRRRI